MKANLIQAQCDWLTVTTKDHQRRQDWREAFDALISKEQAAGYRAIPAQRRGYVGKAIGHGFCGEFQDISMLVLSSDWAHKYGQWFEPDGAHITRCDVQCTFEMPLPEGVLPRRWYEYAVKARPKNGHPTKYSWQEGTDGGFTINAGRRVSAQMGRIYDKGVEQEIARPRQIIRWEVEYKDILAQQVGTQYFTSSQPEDVAIALCQQFFSLKNLPFPELGERSRVELKFPQNLPDVEQNLKWLAGPVASAVKRSVDWVGIERTLCAVLSKVVETNSDQDGIIEAISILADEGVLS